MSHSRHLISLAGAGIVALSSVALAACGSGGGDRSAVARLRRIREHDQPAVHAAVDLRKGQHREHVAGHRPCRLRGQDALPVQGGSGDEERVLGGVRERMAAASGERKADGRRWGNGIEAGNDSAL